MGLVGRVLRGSGRVPERYADTLRAEGVVLWLEELTGRLRVTRLREPGRRSFGTDAESTAAALVVTGRRLFVWTGRGDVRGRLVDVPLEAGGPRGVGVSAPEPGRLHLGFELADFHRDRSGAVELWLRTAEAERVAGWWR